VFSLEGELFFSIFEFEEESNFMVSMRITSIDEEPLSFITLDINHVRKIFLDRLTLDIIRESRSIDMTSIHRDH
jgi:hypothetical protein